MTDDCTCGGGYFVLGSTDGHCGNCPAHRRSALVTCPHDWIDRGVPGDEWRECWLCGDVMESCDHCRTDGVGHRDDCPRFLSS